MRRPEHFWRCPPRSNEDSDVAAPKVAEARDRVAQTPDRAEPDPGVSGHVPRALAAEANAKRAAMAESEI